MSEHEDIEQDLAGRLARAAATVDGAGVTRAGIEARRQERARGRRVRQGAGAAVAAGLLVALGVAAVASGGEDGTTVAADGGGVSSSTTTTPATTFPSVPCLEAPTTTSPPTTSTRPESTTTTVTTMPTTTAPPPAPDRGSATTEAGVPETTYPGDVPVSSGPDVPEPRDLPCAGVEPNPSTTTTTATTLPPTTVPTTPAPDPPSTTTEPAWPPALTGGTHGGEVWGVYLAVVHAEEGVDAPELVEAEAQAAAVGYDAGSGDVACDQGASEALGLDPERSYLGSALYFATEADARRFVDLYQPGVVGLAAVQTYCMD